MTEKEKARFWTKIGQEAEGGCWPWVGDKDVGGYGRFYLHGKLVSAHRAAWMLFRGDIAEGLCVCHRCDNPSCCNPAHMFLGTHKENMLDRGQKGRSNGGSMSGERNPQAKLTEADVIEIKRLLSLGVRQKEIAKMFGTQQAHISLIKTGKIWKDEKAA